VILNISATLYYKGDVLQAHAGAAKAAIGLYDSYAVQYSWWEVLRNCWIVVDVTEDIMLRFSLATLAP